MEEAIIRVISYEKREVKGVSLECELEQPVNERKYCYSDVQEVKDDWDRVVQNKRARPTKSGDCTIIRRYHLVGDLYGNDGPIDALATVEDELIGKPC